MAARKTAANVAAGGAGAFIAAMADLIPAENPFRHILIAGAPAISLVVSGLFSRALMSFDAWQKNRSVKLAEEAAREAVRRQLENPHLTEVERAEATASLRQIDQALVQEKLNDLKRLATPPARRKPRGVDPTVAPPTEEEE